LDDQIKVVENRIAAESQRDAGKLKEGCACHAPQVAAPARGVKLTPFVI
jgi:hypothetical protein